MTESSYQLWEVGKIFGVSNRVQLLLDKYYHAAYEKIWSDDRLSIEQKLEATERAHDRAWARIERETGYHCRP